MATRLVPGCYWAEPIETAYSSRRLSDVLGNPILDRGGGALPVRAVLRESRTHRRGVSADFEPHPRSGESRRTAVERRPLSKISGLVRVDTGAEKHGRWPWFRGPVLSPDRKARANLRSVHAIRDKLERARTTPLCAVRRRANRPAPGNDPRTSGFNAFELKAKAFRIFLNIHDSVSLPVLCLGSALQFTPEEEPHGRPRAIEDEVWFRVEFRQSTGRAPDPRAYSGQ